MDRFITATEARTRHLFLITTDLELDDGACLIPDPMQDQEASPTPKADELSWEIGSAASAPTI